MNDRIEDLQREIKAMEDEMYRQEMANDYYYTKGSYTEDKHFLTLLKRELQELIIEENSKNVIPFRKRSK